MKGRQVSWTCLTQPPDNCGTGLGNRNILRRLSLDRVWLLRERAVGAEETAGGELKMRRRREVDGVSGRADFQHASTEREIAAEKAASLGRAGRRLERALRALAEHDSGSPAEPSGREELVEEAGEALFFYLVQREACGLRDSASVLAELAVPAEVQWRMGLRKRRGT